MSECKINWGLGFIKLSTAITMDGLLQSLSQPLLFFHVVFRERGGGENSQAATNVFFP